MNNNDSHYTDHYMIAFNDAREMVYKNTLEADKKTISIRHSAGHILADEIFAQEALPPFDNTAMDGYAVCAADLKGASITTPVKLNLVGITAAGDFPNNEITPKGTAWKIMTGAPVPKGYDAIIPVENTELNDSTVLCFSAPKVGAHIRCKGEDFLLKEKIGQKGKLINSNAMMAYSSQGIQNLNVFKKPTVAIFSTGKELVDGPASALKPGQIRNSNKPFILDWLSDYPIDTIDAGTNLDDCEKFERDLNKQLENGTDIIISSGAVSMGDFDFIPQAIQKLGGKIIFHKSKIKPGKPILFAKFKNGSCYFGLPGNPISAAIGLRFFVATAIRKTFSLPIEEPQKAFALSDYRKKIGFRSILKSKARINKEGVLTTEILDGQESFKIKPLLYSNGWSVIDESVESLKANTLIDFYPSKMQLE